MNLTDLNRYGGVGASGHLVELGGLRILIDCGLHPKKSGWDAPPDLRFLEANPPDVIVLTHCHLDHLGALPLACRAHPRAPVMMTVPSAKLAERLLRNSVNVMRREAEEGGKQDAVLYTMPDVKRAVGRIAPMAFGQTRRLGVGSDEIEVTFFPSGHVAGAAAIELCHRRRSIFFTGDVQFDAQRIVGGAKFPTRHFDTIVTETTRGATERQVGKDRESEVARLVHAIGRTLDRGGSVLIPVFALGRMQEMFLILHEAVSKKQLQRPPIFAAGLGMDICNYMDEITRSTGLANFHRSVLRELNVKPPPRNLVPGRQPQESGIFVLSSGMMVEKTPSHAMAASLLGHAENAVMFVGYCDPDTAGGRLLATSRGETFLFEALDYQTPVKASVERFELTGHADREELLEFALQADPRAIVLNHGDPPARQWFADAIAEKAPKVTVLDPTPLVTYEV
ncbi:MAG: MBL fold metallo-hydrolase [Opitutaceae bacterium]